MPLSESRPVLERIMQVVKQRLEVLTTNVYPNSPIVEVIRPCRTDTYETQSWQILVLLTEHDEVPELARAGNPPACAYMAKISLVAHIMPSETDPTPQDEYASIIHADMVESLTDSGNPLWMQWGNLAIDSKIGGMEPLAADGGIDGFSLTLEITYRVSEWSPYEVRA
jgi:hypothetical protein